MPVHLLFLICFRDADTLYSLSPSITLPAYPPHPHVNNLHPNLEDVDLKEAFEPFGFLELIQARGVLR